MKSFDQHFNKYTSKLIDQLQIQTNNQLPLDPRYNTTTVFSIVQYVQEVINEPIELYSMVTPLKWNVTLRHNHEILETYSSFLHFVPFYASLKPWLVFLMSCYDSFLDNDSINMSQISNQAMKVISKMSTQGISMIVLSFSSIVAWLLTLSNFAFNVFLYFTIVHYLMKEDNDLVETCLKVAPDQVRKHLQKSLTESIKGIFLSSF
jgi:hypothetical protein